MKDVPWLKESFPDMLWICSLISYDEDGKGMEIVSRTLDVVDDAIKTVLSPEEAASFPVIDGRLTYLERLPSPVRELVLSELDRMHVYEISIPEQFAHSLGMYSDAPGSWLIEPWRRQGLSIDWEVAQRFLSGVIRDASHGQSDVTTKAKFISLYRRVKAGKISFADAQMPKLLSRYPNNLTDEEKPVAESLLRAAWMSHRAAEDARAENEGQKSGESESLRWAKTFWQSNWNIYTCQFDDSPGVPAHPDDDVSLDEAVEGLTRQVDELSEKFFSLATTVDPDLYEPDSYEVLTGITLRALRSVRAAAQSPLYWSGEHGYPLLRSLIEALIIFRWLVNKGDPAMYVRFKDYGRGRLKLLKLNLEEYMDKTGEPQQEMKEFHEHLEAEVNQELWEEWQTIDLSGTFSGVSARDMANEVGMENEYKFLFAPASGATHGEWTTLDRFVLERCRNPLHRWHRVPRQNYSTLIGTELIVSAINVVDELVEEYESSVR